MKQFMTQFIREEEGAGLVEYALLLSLIAIVCIAAITGVGTAITGLFTDISGQV